MKNQIKNEIIFEKMRTKIDQGYVRAMQVLLDENPMTFKSWVNTGRILPMTAWRDDHKDVTVHIDCTDIVKYAGFKYIEVLKSGVFFVDAPVSPFSSYKLHEAEQFMWDNLIDKK